MFFMFTGGRRFEKRSLEEMTVDNRRTFDWTVVDSRQITSGLIVVEISRLKFCRLPTTNRTRRQIEGIHSTDCRQKRLKISFAGLLRFYSRNRSWTGSEDRLVRHLIREVDVPGLKRNIEQVKMSKTVIIPQNWRSMSFKYTRGIFEWTIWETFLVPKLGKWRTEFG